MNPVTVKTSLRTCLCGVLLACSLHLAAAPIDEARQLYNSGQYSKAIVKLKTILKGAPKDGNANYLLGASYYALGDYDNARPALEKAIDRGVSDAPALMAEIAMKDYDFEGASGYIDSWEDILRRNKKEVPADLDRMRRRVLSARNMMQRVEKIEIIDSVNVDAQDFFSAYVLSADAGYLLDSGILPEDLGVANDMVYRQRDGKQLLWADNSRHHRLMRMAVLDDGSFEGPYAVGGNLGEGGDADYPFLCADGVTFYFANNGENSLGGYDIFMSRFDSEGNPLQPQNIGMPYNSPANDFMLAIDEDNNLGWWATDRNNIPGMVTIYTFRPNTSRVNVPIDDPALRDYASLRHVKISPEGRNLIIELDEAMAEVDEDPEEFAFRIADGVVYTRYSDFKSEQARQAMRQLMQRDRDMAQMEGRLRELRSQYAAGNHGVAQEILTLERRILAEPPIRQRLVNTIITNESK